MRILSIAPDGGEKSTVRGLYLIELKRLFSIVFLWFSVANRETFHSHAFHALSWVVWGELYEERQEGDVNVIRRFRPSIFPKVTTRANIHRVHTLRPTLVFTLRGPWVDNWIEDRPTGRVTLTHGRKVVS